MSPTNNSLSLSLATFSLKNQIGLTPFLFDWFLLIDLYLLI